MAPPALVSVTLFVPYLGIPHAGGEYVRRHLDALADMFEIAVIAPNSTENQRACDLLANSERFRVHFLMKKLDPIHALIKIVKFFRGASLGFDLELSLLSSTSCKDVLAKASIVEFQWTESASLSRKIRKLAPQARQVLVAHDVLSQRWQRESASSERTLRRLFFKGRAIFARLAERRYYQSVDTVVVFSEKDAALARLIAPEANVQHVDPPLHDDGMTLRADAKDRSGKAVLFTAAFGRPENDEAALWLLDKIWPNVLSRVPDASLTLAGANPSAALVALAARFESVRLTGYVDDLAPYYDEADVFVAPLLHGAGVKFKNITAMLWEVPIVSTPIGAEGIGDVGHYLGVTEDPAEFTESIVAGLENEELRRRVALSARRWAGSRYSQEAFLENLRSIYAWASPDEDYCVPDDSSVIAHRRR